MAAVSWVPVVCILLLCLFGGLSIWCHVHRSIQLPQAGLVQLGPPCRHACCPQRQICLPMAWPPYQSAPVRLRPSLPSPDDTWL